jgi:hypothetical protein
MPEYQRPTLLRGSCMGHLRQHAEQAADILRQRFPKGFEPRLFVQLGTGTHQKPLLDREFGTVDMDELPGMPVRSSASPAGHDLRLSWGHCQDTPVLLATGRRHLYEGFGPAHLRGRVLRRR